MPEPSCSLGKEAESSGCVCADAAAQFELLVTPQPCRAQGEAPGAPTPLHDHVGPDVGVERLHDALHSGGLGEIICTKTQRGTLKPPKNNSKNPRDGAEGLSCLLSIMINSAPGTNHRFFTFDS